MQKQYCDKNSNEFKVNLFPLPAANIDEWLDQHVELTKTKIKYHYKTYCAGHRFDLLNTLVNIYKPKIIICFGQGHEEEFKLAYWGKDLPKSYTEEKIEISDRNNIKILSSDNPTKLFISPFLGRNLTADVELRKIAEVIKNHLTKT